VQVFPTPGGAVQKEDAAEAFGRDEIGRPARVTSFQRIESGQIGPSWRAQWP